MRQGGFGPRHKKMSDRNRAYIKRMTERVEAAEVGRAFVTDFRPDADGKVAGRSPNTAQKILQASMERVGRMSEEERQRFRVLSPPDTNEESLARRAMALRVKGIPYCDVADELGITEDAAWQYVHRQLDRSIGEEVRNVDVARRLHLARLEHLMAVQWAKATNGDTRATELCLKIMERQSKLVGLDAPQKVDITHRLRLLAEQEGLDPEELIAEAQAVIKTLPK